MLHVVKPGPVWLAQNGKRRADTDIHINVRGTVEWIEHHRIFSIRRLVRHDHRMLVLFGSQHADAFAHAQAMEQNFIRVNVQLLLHLSLHVRVPLRTDDVRKPRPADLRFDHFGGERNSGEQP